MQLPDQRSAFNSLPHRICGGYLQLQGQKSVRYATHSGTTEKVGLLSALADFLTYGVMSNIKGPVILKHRPSKNQASYRLTFSML